MKYLNLGCGSRFHSEWVNLDSRRIGPDIQVHDLRKGIPFADNSFEVVYHSHVLEHLHKTQARFFLKECWRVLKSAGIIRVVIPDLEGIMRNYILALDKAANGHTRWQNHYDWMMLELYDQAVREEPGGEMSKYLKQDPIPNEHFVYERIGVEASRLIQSIRKKRPQPPRNLVSRLRQGRACSRLVGSVREKVIKTILGENDYRALLVGRFRLGGEIHLWMYDRFSLSRLLIQSGFEKPVQRGPLESTIRNWERYHLDTEPDGTIYKPDSLYMEAIKL